MSGTTATVPGPVAPAARRRRWHRAAVPFLVLLLFYLVTGVSHVVQQPDLDDRGTLAPTGTGPDGSSRLAGLLAANQVTVRVVTSSDQARAALTAGAGRPATVFVPAPHFLDGRFLARVLRAHPGTRVVLVRPDAGTAHEAGFVTGPSRWAADTVSPGCPVDVAVRAGPAAVLRSRYAVDPEADVEVGSPAGYRCYDGGLAAINSGPTQFVVVGATDPFRNSRIDEAGNAALAVGLLSQDQQVIWVDLHRAEPGPTPPPPPPPRDDDFDYRQPDRSATGASPVWDAFPPTLWAVLTLLGLLAVLAAVVRSRRLGPPVAEPMPAVVPATEIVVGWGRLYQRSRSRDGTLQTLRSAAVRRMSYQLDPTGALTDDDALTTAVAARVGLPVEQVRAVLHPAAPTTNDQLASAVADLDTLTTAVERATARPDASANPGGTP